MIEMKIFTKEINGVAYDLNRLSGALKSHWFYAGTETMVTNEEELQGIKDYQQAEFDRVFPPLSI